MNESEIIALVDKHRRGSLTPGEQARLAELLEDPAARRLLVRDMTLECALRGTLRVARNAGIEVARGQRAPTRPGIAASWPRRLSLAAAALLVAGVGVWWMAAGGRRQAGSETAMVVRVEKVSGFSVQVSGKSEKTPLKAGDEVRAEARIETGKDGAVTLAWTRTGVPGDGKPTTVQLDKNSKLDTGDWKLARPLRLDSGRLDAVVAKQDPARPFVIETPHARATVLGTRLSLRANPAETELGVAEGLVQADSLGSRASGKIAGGQSAIFRAEQREIAVLGETLFVEEFDNGLDAWSVEGLNSKGYPRPTTEADRRAVSIRVMERGGKKVNCAVIDAVDSGDQWISLARKNVISATSTWETVSYMVTRTAPSGETRVSVGTEADQTPVRTERRPVKVPVPIPHNQWVEFRSSSWTVVEGDGQSSLLTRSYVNGKLLGDMTTFYDGKTAPHHVAYARAVRSMVAVDRIEVRRLISIIHPPGATP